MFLCHSIFFSLIDLFNLISLIKSGYSLSRRSTSSLRVGCSLLRWSIRFCSFMHFSNCFSSIATEQVLSDVGLRCVLAAFHLICFKSASIQESSSSTSVFFDFIFISPLVVTYPTPSLLILDSYLLQCGTARKYPWNCYN